MGDQIDILSALNYLTKGKKVIPRDVFKDFNLFLNNRDHEIGQSISVVLLNFHPTSPLEKLLRAKLVNRYKVSSEVWKMLMSNDSLYINQALKFDWFFSNNDDPADFLQNIIPKLPYSTRLKIFNRYASRLRNTTAGEALYVGVRLRYGINTAAYILPACSESFVHGELGKFTTTLPRHVVMALLDKYPALSAKYVEKLVDEKTAQKCKNIEHYTCVFIKLSNNNFSTFLHLLDEHEKRFPCLRLGRRQLKKLFKNHFDVVVTDCEKFARRFSVKQFFRRLSLDQFKQVYASSLLPTKLLELFEVRYHNIAYQCLDYLKPSVRPNVLTSAFQEKYNRDCTSEDLLLKFPSFWLQHLPFDARIKWIDAKIPEMNSITMQAECIAYLPCEFSIPRLKKLMTSQSDHDVRVSIVRQMIRTVGLNACPSAFKDIVTYTAKRVRNETCKFKRTVLIELAYLNKFLLKLDLDDWTHMLELTNILCNGGDRFWNLYDQLTIIFGHLIHTCFMKNVDADPYFRKLVDLDLLHNKGELSPSTVDIGNHTAFQKDCIEWFVNEIPNMKLESYSYDMILRLLDNICEYNRTHKQSIIEIPDWLMVEVESIITDPDTSYLIDDVMRTLKANKSTQLYDDLLVMCFPRYAPCWVLCRFLKSNPDIILSNCEVLVKTMVGERFREYSYFYRKCRLYDNCGIPRELIKSSEIILEESVRENMDIPEFKILQKTKSHAAQMLAFLHDATTYLALCSKHVPSRKKIEDYSKEVQIEFAIQRAFCKSLTHISTPLETVSLLPAFTKGDYLKIVCGSLIGVSVKIPENIILPILEKWVDCPVSLRKHILRLIYKIAPVEYSINAIKDIFKTEKNLSLRLVLFLQVRDSFVSEPTNASYNIFISIVKQLKEDDKESLDKLFEIDNIHDAYLSKYIKLVWQLIESEWMNVLPNGKTTMIDSIDKNLFKSLDNDVCDMLLEHELLSKLPNTTLSKLVSYYLLYCSSDMIRLHRLEMVMVSLGPSIKAHWNDYNRSGSGWAFPIRHVIGHTIESLCVESMNTQEPARASLVLSDLKKSLLQFVMQRDILKESVQLDIYALYLSLKGSGDESKYASALADLYNDYIQQFESQCGYALLDHLICEIPMVSNTKLAHELLKNHSHPTCHILASMMSGCVLSENEEMQMYEVIIDHLSSSKIPDVQASAAHYFKTLEAPIAMVSSEPQIVE